MTPKEVKDLARSASITCDGELALKVCHEIAEKDLYINVPKPAPTQAGKFTTARWGDRPCKCGCGEMISPGSKVWWEPNWGISIPSHIGK